jgi:hypothetical protein
MESDLFIALRLAKEGFGSPESILAMPVDVVLAALEYSTFLAEYEETAMELNRNEDR